MGHVKGFYKDKAGRTRPITGRRCAYINLAHTNFNDALLALYEYAGNAEEDEMINRGSTAWTDQYLLAHEEFDSAIAHAPTKEIRAKLMEAAWLWSEYSTLESMKLIRGVVIELYPQGHVLPHVQVRNCLDAKERKGLKAKHSFEKPDYTDDFD